MLMARNRPGAPRASSPNLPPDLFSFTEATSTSGPLAVRSWAESVAAATKSAERNAQHNDRRFAQSRHSVRRTLRQAVLLDSRPACPRNGFRQLSHPHDGARDSRTEQPVGARESHGTECTL